MKREELYLEYIKSKDGPTNENLGFSEFMEIMKKEAARIQEMERDRADWIDEITERLSDDLSGINAAICNTKDIDKLNEEKSFAINRILLLEMLIDNLNNDPESTDKLNLLLSRFSTLKSSVDQRIVVAQSMKKETPAPESEPEKSKKKAGRPPAEARLLGEILTVPELERFIVKEYRYRELRDQNDLITTLKMCGYIKTNIEKVVYLSFEKALNYKQSPQNFNKFYNRGNKAIQKEISTNIECEIKTFLERLEKQS